MEAVRILVLLLNFPFILKPVYLGYDTKDHNSDNLTCRAMDRCWACIRIAVMGFSMLLGGSR